MWAAMPLERFHLRALGLELAGHRLRLETVADDELLAALERDGAWDESRNPYWGQVWPAALALVRALAQAGRLGGARVLDLGCGPGLAGIVAARLGAAVTLADVVPDALELAGRNARANGVRAELVLCDLRDLSGVAGGFDLVLASDLLYEPWQPEALAAALAQLVGPGGRALVADPLRPWAEPFAELARAHGFAVETTQTAVSSAGRPVAVRLFAATRTP
jgi:predicted nicotinamide N-methyase